MNNRFKYRIWNKEAKCFVSTYENKAGENRLKHFIDANGNIGKLIYGLFEGVSEDNIVSSENYIIQQYTSLKDKNNKEIYEGDRVKFIEYSTNKYLMGNIIWNYYSDDEYVNGLECWIIKGDNIYNLPLSCALNGGVEYGRGTDVIENTLEVVGNIMENTELLA